MTIANNSQQIAAVFKKSGPCVDLATAASVLGITRQRMLVLHHAGRLGALVLNGRRCVVWRCVECRLLGRRCQGFCMGVVILTTGQALGGW